MAHTVSIREQEKPIRGMCRVVDCTSFIWEQSETLCWWHCDDGKQKAQREKTVQDIKIHKAQRLKKVIERNRREAEEERQAHQKFKKGKAHKGNNRPSERRKHRG